MKKILFSVLLFVMGALTASANEGSSDAVFAPAETNSQFALQAKMVDNTVILQWTPVAKQKPEGFNYYKIVRSERNATPVYPDDGYIGYSSEVGFSTFTDTNPLYGKTYYRVCAIYDSNSTGLRPRYCSNVVVTSKESQKSEVPPAPSQKPSEPVKQQPEQQVPPKPVNEPQKQPEPKKEPQKQTQLEPKKEPQNTITTNALKKRLDTLLLNFQKSLDKREISSSDKASIIAKAIERYTNLAQKTQSASVKKMCSYMIERLNQMKNQYVEEDTTEIEGILSGL
ncbi:MAG: hypothetical protein HHAS10_05170 [Candidatus Altimarinota bacterium]